MVIEPRSDSAFRNASFRYAINIGSDGDLSKNWKLLPGHLYSESGPGVPDQLNLGASGYPSSDCFEWELHFYLK